MGKRQTDKQRNQAVKDADSQGGGETKKHKAKGTAGPLSRAPQAAGQVDTHLPARSHACAWQGLGRSIAPVGWSPACPCTSPPSAGSLAGSSTACHTLSSWAETGEDRLVLGCPGLPPAHAPTQAQAFVPTHRHGHGLRAHEVLVDLVALRLLVLHTVIQVLILLHCVTAGCGVRQGHRSPQARDPSEPSQTKVVSPQIPSAGSCPLRPPGHSLVPLRPPGQGYVPKHSLNLVGQATVDIFIPHTLLLSGEGPRGARMV